jgi:hypothetical protein
MIVRVSHPFLKKRSSSNSEWVVISDIKHTLRKQAEDPFGVK